MRPTTSTLTVVDPDTQAWITTVLPPDTTVRFGEQQFFIPRGETRIVATRERYELVSHGTDGRPWRQRLAARLRRLADRVAGVA